MYAETMDHFVCCTAYGEETEPNWKDIFGSNTTRQITIGLFVENRFRVRQDIIDNIEAGQTSDQAPILQLV